MTEKKLTPEQEDLKARREKYPPNSEASLAFARQIAKEYREEVARMGVWRSRAT